MIINDPDGDLHVIDDGPRGAPVLLLLHGTASSLHAYDRLAPLLTSRYRVIMIDLLGHGRSAKPDDAPYEIVDHGRRTGRVLDRLGVPRAIVVGHSTGGSVATALAEQRPELVRGLVLINSGPRLDAYTAPPLAIDPAAWDSLTDDQLRQAMESAFSRPGFRPPQELVEDLRGMTFRSFAAILQAAEGYLRAEPLPDRLARLGLPLLVIFGADDRRWLPSSAADYQVVPGARLKLLPGLGHTPQLEDPERTAEPLLDFVERLNNAP
ncbi:alpha/beta fold hydrolase [Microlunatus sp. GCM10028923]|uniref:alpha/beta fold hydrolase n=1 Tax=Microlunatus sp. GCM10028923 TaxID=3273400 RepID=UPI00361134E9